MIILVLRLVVAFIGAFLMGKLIAKFKLPSILGWLIAGMILGPHALSIMNQNLLSTEWYQVLIHILECTVGLMIGTELVWKKIKSSGKSIIITTLTQSIGTFIIVSLVFGILFYFMEIPLYLAILFGGIALATAPAPALSIVREFKTDGPVTKTLIPMAALDDIVGCIIFFTTVAIIAGRLSAGNLPIYMIALVVLLPLVIGVVAGLLAGFVLKKERDNKTTLVLLIISILFASGIGFVFNNLVLPKPILNFMLIGMAFSATFANIISEKQLDRLMNLFNPILGIAMVIVILNLGAPLDYHLIMGAGLFTVIYIISRAIGKYMGAYFGASITKSPRTVKKFLGLTLLPHSGVSLVFTGIAVSILNTPAPECAQIIQGTIAAAAVINEIIAVILAKKGFEWSGEFNKSEDNDNNVNSSKPLIITISRQHGSGGREVGRQLAKKLQIPFYDQEIIELAAKESPIDKSFFENSETNNGIGNILQELANGALNNLSLNDRVFIAQTKIISDIAQKGNSIIVGRCADYILKNQVDVIRVFIYADIESRKNRIVNIYKEVKNIENKMILKTEKKRVAYYNHYTKQKFGDAENYDICLNSSELGIDTCVKIIESIYNERNS